MVVIYWCAKCKHMIPDYVQIKCKCDICGGDTVRIEEKRG